MKLYFDEELNQDFPIWKIEVALNSVQEQDTDMILNLAKEYIVANATVIHMSIILVNSLIAGSKKLITAMFSGN